MADVDMEEAGLQRMAQGDPEEPVYMLNLLKYRDTAEEGYSVDGMSGMEAYQVYGRRFAELNPRFGGEPLWMGRTLNTVIGAEDWDTMILVRYPTRRQFLEMVADPDYQAIAPIRAAALADSRLVEMSELVRNF